MKLDRSAFIYLDPQGYNQLQFAQCKTCLMFDSAKSECNILKEKKGSPRWILCFIRTQTSSLSQL